MCTSEGLQFSQTDDDFTLRRVSRAIGRYLRHPHVGACSKPEQMH